MSNDKPKETLGHKIELSAILTFVGIVILFSGAVIVTLIAPTLIDSTWTMPTTPYQVQMYEISDPNFYISSSPLAPEEIQAVYHLKKDFTLLAFQESETVKIDAPPELEKYVTRHNDKKVKLTSRLFLLRRKKPTQPDSPQNYISYEIYDPKLDDAFAVAPTQGMLENWVDQNYDILDDSTKHPYHKSPGVIFVNNPIEYKVQQYEQYGKTGWRYDPNGEPIANLEQLKSNDMGFLSRQQLIRIGETIYAHEGCWYCHTDQTRTLVQDTVLNGSDSYPAPPSSPNEYIYDHVTFPGTHRIGPDISRTGVKRPSRDWHRSHFWAPKTASQGSIMPSFQHFFDNDPRGTGHRLTGIPNYKFEAVFQYLMTKGTRITPPTQAWWLGKDPIKTIEIIDGERRL